MDKDNWRIRRLGVDDIVTRFDCGDDEGADTRLLYFDLESLGPS